MNLITGWGFTGFFAGRARNGPPDWRRVILPVSYPVRLLAARVGFFPSFADEVVMMKRIPAFFCSGYPSLVFPELRSCTRLGKHSLDINTSARQCS